MAAGEMREVQWVKPELVPQVRFVEWTAERRLRPAAFLGLRSDKSAREVRREANDGLGRFSSARRGTYCCKSSRRMTHGVYQMGELHALS